ncbi:site-specific DNA-methyltransferase [Nitrospira sp. Nam74]
MSTSELTVQMVPIEQINPVAYNPRKDLQPGDAEYEALKRSILTFGYVEPLVWNARTGNLVGGHQRLKVLKSLGYTAAHCTVVDVDLSTEKAMNVALNKISGEWDVPKLKELLTDLTGTGYDVTVTGFGSQELKDLLRWQTDDEKDAALNEAPVRSSGPTTAKPGDVWILGGHRLMCGDSTNPVDVAALLAADVPRLMVTDPPYGVNYDPAWRQEIDGSDNHALGKVQNDDQVDWTPAYALFPGDVAYVWHAGVFAAAVARHLDEVGFIIRSQIIWAKQHFVFSRGAYHWQHEPCWYAVRKGATGNWQGDRKQTTLWELSNLNPFGGAGWEDQSQRTDHGTQKPIEAMRRPILNHTQPGEWVYDPFLGSGTTLIAAEDRGRRCLAMEIDPGYCDVTIERWQTLTGEKATRLVHGGN